MKKGGIPTLDEPLALPEDTLDLDSLDIPILTDVIPSDTIPDQTESDDDPAGEKGEQPV